MSTHSSGSLESLHSCHVQFHAFQSSKLLVKVPQSLLTDAVCPLPDQSELSKLIICHPMTAHLATMTLKRTRGRSWTQMGKSSMPALPRHSRAHMFSQFLRVMLVTETWQWSGVSLSTLYASRDLVWPERLLPCHVFSDWSSLQGHLLQHTLQECSKISTLI